MPHENVLRQIVELLAGRKSRGEMVAAFLREVSVLLVVFAPLDAAFNPGAVSWWGITLIVAIAFGIGYTGMRLEETRK